MSGTVTPQGYARRLMVRASYSRVGTPDRIEMEATADLIREQDAKLTAIREWADELRGTLNDYPTDLAGQTAQAMALIVYFQINRILDGETEAT